jgi:hypothetical protein
MLRLIFLAAVIGLLLPMAAHAAPYDCGAAPPAQVRFTFETSPYAKRNHLTTELPIITRHSDGTCTALLHVHDWRSGAPSGDLNLDLVIVYFPCPPALPVHTIAADSPNACPWINLRNYPAV